MLARYTAIIPFVCIILVLLDPSLCETDVSHAECADAATPFQFVEAIDQAAGQGEKKIAVCLDSDLSRCACRYSCTDRVNTSYNAFVGSVTA